MHGQQKNKQKQNPIKKIEFVFLTNEIQGLPMTVRPREIQERGMNT